MHPAGDHKIHVSISKVTDLSSFHKLQILISFRFANYSVPPLRISQDIKQRLNDDITTNRARLHVDAGRELWIVRKVIRPGNQNFWY